MNNLNLLRLRDAFYKQTIHSLKEKNITFKKNLLLYEISIDKKDIAKLKRLIRFYVQASINAFYKIKINLKNSYLANAKNLILNFNNFNVNLILGLGFWNKNNLKFQ